MTESFKTPIRLDDVEDRLAAIGVQTISFYRLKNRKRAYMIKCATVDDFMVALHWLQNTKPVFDGFDLNVCADDTMGLEYSL